MSFLEIFGARDKSIRLDFVLDWMGSQECFSLFHVTYECMLISTCNHKMALLTYTK